MSEKGFSLIEVLIVVLIFGIMLTAVYSVFKNFFSGYKVESKNMETEVEAVINTHLLGVDIAHAGLGLADNLDNLPIEWDGQKLTIRSTLNSTNKITDGWVLVNCSDGKWNELSKDNLSNFDTTTNMVFLNIVKKEFAGNGFYGKCPTNAVLIGYPYDADVTSGCITQFCNIITYSLSLVQTISYCNPNTKNLIRRIGGNAINNIDGSHVLDCVASFEITFDYDYNANGIIEDNERNVLFPNTAQVSDIKKKLKAVNVYILVQEGKKDISYNFEDVVGDSQVIFYDENDNGVCDTEDICLKLPANYIHYRWKKIYLKIIPEDL